MQPAIYSVFLARSCAGDALVQPVWIVLTTAGDDPDRKSIGWEVHERRSLSTDGGAARG